jgi:excisionase family DNA binding protein
MTTTKQQPGGLEPYKPLFYRFNAAAEMLGIKRGKLRLLVMEGQLRSAKIGRATVIAARELERYAASIIGDGA